MDPADERTDCKRKLEHINLLSYIIGVDGSFKAADVRECADKVLTAFVCSYVPSLVQLN